MDLSPASLPDVRWSTALPDWKERIMDGRSLVPDLPLFEASAEKAIRIFSRLRVPDLIGTPSYGEVCDRWVFDLVAAIFGSYDPETKARKIREIFLLVPKKNGKSSLAAAILVTAAILNERPQAELLMIAPTQKIANIAFKQAAGIIALDENLSALFHLQQHRKEITHRTTQAVIMILSADGDVITGSKATYILVDESHVLLSKAKAAEIMIELRGGLASRPEGFLIQITTQSKAPPVGEFRRELDTVRAVRDGTIRRPILAVLYELPLEVAQDEGWRDERTWAAVNPNLERSVSLDYLRDQLAKADHDGPDALALFISQHLNVQIGQGQIQDRWAGATYWPRAVEAGLTLEDMIARCDAIVAGIDGGGLDDLLGLTFVGRERRTKRWLSWSRAWAHEIVLDRRKSLAPQLRDLNAAGELVICTTPKQDVTELVALLEQVNDAGLFPEKNAVGLDPMGVAALVDAAIEAGLTDDQLCAVSQGYRLNGAIKGAERKLFDGTLAHADQGLMDWCVSNARTILSGNAVLVTKAVSGTGKIDPLMALFNAVHLMSLNPEGARPGIDSYVAALLEAAK